MADLDTPTGKARALGFLALAQVIFFKILGAVKALYDRSSPWRLLIDPRKFSCPEGLGDALNRFRRNANDFGYNYAFLCVVASMLCVITSPFSVFIIAALTMAWGYVMCALGLPSSSFVRTSSVRSFIKSSSSRWRRSSFFSFRTGIRSPRPAPPRRLLPAPPPRIPTQNPKNPSPEP
jgi:hypothetical protein